MCCCHSDSISGLIVSLMSVTIIFPVSSLVTFCLLIVVLSILSLSVPLTRGSSKSSVVKAEHFLIQLSYFLTFFNRPSCVYGSEFPTLRFAFVAFRIALFTNFCAFKIDATFVLQIYSL